MKTLFRAPTVVKGEKKTLLYVEDDLSNQKIAQDRLARKYQILLAGTDREACDILIFQGHQLHVILMDIELQDSKLNGLQLCRLLRGKLPAASLPFYARDVKPSAIPIILVTAFANSDLKDSFADAGINYVIPKPVDFVELELAISRCLLRQVAYSDNQ